MTHPLTPREKVALKPCPFCGSEAWLNDYEAKYSDLPPKSRCPQCRSCGASLGYLTTPAKATEAWNRRTALASGSGDHSGGVTDMIGSGDHAELIGVLRADRLPECSFDDGKTWELDGVGVAETFSRAADAIDALLAENAALRAMAERVSDGSMEQTDKLLAMHDRATEAERKLAEAVGLLRGVDGGAATQDWWRVKVRTFLSKEAERG